MRTILKKLALYLPHALIVIWAASNFVFANRFEYYSSTIVVLFYLAVLLVAVITTYIAQNVFSKLKPAVFIFSYITFFMMFLTPAIRELLDPFMRYRFTLLIVFSIILGLTYFAIKAIGRENSIKLFSLFFLLLAAIPTGQYLQFLLFSDEDNTATLVTFRGPAVQKPNVYYIILDAYMRSDILKQNLDFDNSDFMTFLNKRGFFDVGKSFVAYPTTVYSIVTTFRMRHTTEFEPDIWSKRFRSDTFKNFAALGYSSHFMSQMRGVVPCPENVKCYEDVPKSDLLYIGRLGTTLLKTIPLLENLLLKIVPKRFVYELNEVTDLHRTLRNISAKEPFFFYGHILMPHSPYTRDAACNPVDTTASGDFTSFRWNVRHKYINFLKCGNRQFKELIKTLIKKDPEAIVIVQGDHGGYFTNNRYSNSDHEPTPGPEPWRIPAMEGAYANLNVLRIPQTCRDRLYPTMSPVNTFRLVFSCLTDHDPNYVPDKSFWIDKNNEKIKLIRENGKWLFRPAANSKQ